MKVLKMNTSQQKAFYNIKYAARFLFNTLEVTVFRNSECSEEYQIARKTLADHRGLVNTLYYIATTGIYYDWYDQEGLQIELAEIRSCGAAWLMNQCKLRIEADGY